MGIERFTNTGSAVHQNAGQSAYVPVVICVVICAVGFHNFLWLLVEKIQ